MISSVYARKYWIFASLLAISVFALLATAAIAQEQLSFDQQIKGTLTFTISDEGITSSSTHPAGGPYNVVIHNSSSKNKGIVMMGDDLCCSPYLRFTKVLAPGQQQTFRWYFPAGRTVTLKDLEYCVHAARSCSRFVVGDMSTSIPFS